MKTVANSFNSVSKTSVVTIQVLLMFLHPYKGTFPLFGIYMKLIRLLVIEDAESKNVVFLMLALLKAIGACSDLDTEPVRFWITIALQWILDNFTCFIAITKAFHQFSSKEDDICDDIINSFLRALIRNVSKPDTARFTLKQWELIKMRLIVHPVAGPFSETAASVLSKLQDSVCHLLLISGLFLLKKIQVITVGEQEW